MNKLLNDVEKILPTALINQSKLLNYYEQIRKIYIKGNYPLFINYYKLRSK